MDRRQLIAGCAIAVASFALGKSDRFVQTWIGPAYAANGPRYEYKKVVLPIQFTKGSEEKLNELGAQGWDIAYGFGEVVFMKRAW